MTTITLHELECALAALAIRIERAEAKRDRSELRELRQWRKEILARPIEKSATD